MTKDKVIQFFIEGGKPLSRADIDNLENLDYAVFTAKCRICNHTEIAVCPTAADLENIECPNCCNFTVEPVLPDEELEIYQIDDFTEKAFFVQ